MNKRKLIILSSIALFVIISIYIVRSLETQTFAEANLVHPDYTLFVIEELKIYSEADNALIPVDISYDDKEKLTELMLTSKVSGNQIRKPSSTTLIVEQKFRDTMGSELGFTLHKKNNNYYVAIPADILVEGDEWYKLKSTEIPDFYFDLLEKTPH